MTHGKMYAVIMAGGLGLRLWPASTRKRPKQFLGLVSDRPLLTETLERFQGLPCLEKCFVVAQENQKKAVLNCIGKACGSDSLILEPEGKNTAPCLLLSLAFLRRQGLADEAVVSLVPADHLIRNTASFHTTLERAFCKARDTEKIITIGIPPSYPHTGLGHIKRGQELGKNFYGVEAFVEKPNLALAKRYLKEGGYFWNAGIFVATLKVFLEEFSRRAPNLFSFFGDLEKHCHKPKILAEIYKNLPTDSIDYAIMEKSDRILVTPADFDWNDLGSWENLERALPKTRGNVLKSKGGHTIDSQGNVVFSPEQGVFLVNVQNMIVVSEGDRLLVIPKEDAHRVKEITSFLKRQDPLEEFL